MESYLSPLAESSHGEENNSSNTTSIKDVRHLVFSLQQRELILFVPYVETQSVTLSHLFDIFSTYIPLPMY